jgi:hypothetical protein
VERLKLKTEEILISSQNAITNYLDFVKIGIVNFQLIDLKTYCFKLTQKLVALTNIRRTLIKSKPRGLDSRDQSRSRLSLVSRPDFFFSVEILVYNSESDLMRVDFEN